MEHSISIVIYNYVVLDNARNGREGDGQFMNRQFPVIIEKDKDGVFIVECPVLQECRSYGHTVDEAVDNIREAIAACLEDVQPFLVQIN